MALDTASSHSDVQIEDNEVTDVDGRSPGEHIDGNSAE